MTTIQFSKLKIKHDTFCRITYIRLSKKSIEQLFKSSHTIYKRQKHIGIAYI